jgi:hypothetical protein
MSAKGQRRTLRRLFDHLVGAIKQRLRHGKSERYYRFNLGPRNGHARFGSLADICSATVHVRFTPKSRHVLLQLRMSALGQKRTSARALLGGCSFTALYRR